MKNLVALASLLLVLVPGCGGDTHQSLVDESMPLMREMAATVTTIKDEATAKAAKPKLEVIASKMKDLKARRDKLPAPTEAEMKASIDKYGKEMEELQKKMIGSMMAIQFDPAIQKVLGDIDMNMN